MVATHRVSELQRLYHYEAWANHRMQAALAAVPAHTQALAIWSHLISSRLVWLARLLGEEEPPRDLWAERSLAEAGQALAEVEQRWQTLFEELTDAELGRVVTFHNLRGQPQADTLGDILHHVLLHSSYHRGQVALLAKVEDVSPPQTDFILFAREQQAPPTDSRKLFVAGRSRHPDAVGDR